jgi:hypothetical protein
MDKTLLVVNIFTIIAIVSGPVLALQIQRRLDEGREKRNRKLSIFKNLMSLRATVLSPTFVQSLNLIDVEFDGDNHKEKAVRNAWKVLLDHYVDLGLTTQPISPNLVERGIQLRTMLLLQMGKCLDYDFEEVQIKKGSYYPIALGDVEAEQHAIRRGVLDVLSGKRRIPVGIFEEKFPAINLSPLQPPPGAAPSPPRELGG